MAKQGLVRPDGSGIMRKLFDGFASVQAGGKMTLSASQLRSVSRQVVQPSQDRAREATIVSFPQLAHESGLDVSVDSLHEILHVRSLDCV